MGAHAEGQEAVNASKDFLDLRRPRGAANAWATTPQAVLGYLKTHGFKAAVVDYRRGVYKDGVRVSLNPLLNRGGRGEVLAQPYFADDKTADYEGETRRVHATLARGPFVARYTESGAANGIVIVRAKT